MATINERIAYLRRAEAGWLAYQELLDTLTDEDLERPDTVGFWSGRDLIAHIACWERHSAWLLDQWEVGREQLFSYDFDQSDTAKWDEWNEEQVTPFRSLLLDDVKQFAIETHFSAMARVATSEQVTEQFVSGMTWSHYEWHRDDILGIKDGS